MEWTRVPRPLSVLAPMADVTDAAFRGIIAKYGKPDVTWTEFVSADGLYHTREIQKCEDDMNPLMLDLRYTEMERPIVAQIFSGRADMIEYAARVVREQGFDGVDINMGCPDRSVEKQGAGAALMKDPSRARVLIRAAKRGVAESIPVSVKTRVGYNYVELDTWLPELLAESPAAITIHARTRKEMSLVPARWEHVARAVELRDRHNTHTLILGNGDVSTPAEGRALALETGADGAMIGRGVFGNPWLWSDHVPSVEEKLAVLAEHCRRFEEKCPHKSFAVMKKHFKAYVNGFPGASELRAALMQCTDATMVQSTVSTTETLRDVR